MTTTTISFHFANSCYGQIVFYRTFTYQVPITLLISYIFNPYIFHTYLLPFISLKNHFIIEIDALQLSLTALDPYQDNFLNKQARLPRLGRLEAALSHSIVCNSFRNGLQITNKSRQHTYILTFHSRTFIVICTRTLRQDTLEYVRTRHVQTSFRIR